MTNEEKITRFKAWFQSTNDHPAWRSWRKNSAECRAFYDGDQLSREDLTELEDRGQPAIVVNKIFAKINNLKGAQRLVRQRIGAKPRTRNDVAAAQAVSDTFRYIDYRADYGQEESLTFDDGIIEGIGWLECYVKEDEAGQIEIDIDNEEPQRIRVDPLSRRYDLSDARFISRDKWVDLNEAVELFPDKKSALENLFDSPGPDYSGVAQHGPNDDYDMVEPQGQVAYIDPKRKRVRLVEMWYREFQDVMWMGAEYIPSLRGIKNPITPDNIAMGELGISKTRQKIVRLAIYCGDTSLSDDVTPYSHKLNINKFPFIPFFCFRKKSGEPYGYVLQMRDVQREINKRRSKALHILNTVQIIADVNAVDDIEELREEAARPDGILLKKQGTELSIERNINLAQSQFNIMNQSASDLQDISGVFDEAMGKGTNARSGEAIAQRKQASNQNNLIVLDNLRRTRILLGRFVLGLIKQFLSPEQIVLITDDKGKQRDIDLSSISSALVDIVVEELQSDSSAQEEQFKYLVEVAKSGVAIPPDVIIQASSLKDKDQILQRMQQQTNPALPEGQAPQGLPEQMAADGGM